MGSGVDRTASLGGLDWQKAGRHLVVAAAFVLLVPSLSATPAHADEPPPSETQVPLKVVQGPAGGTLVFVPIHIGDQGPYYFTLDTGASHSAVDKSLAAQLGLPMSDSPVDFSGTIAVSNAQPVKLQKWRVGEFALPSLVVVGLDLPEHRVGPPIQGLLGSDVLSRFDRILIDYAKEQLTLTPRSSGEESGGSPNGR